MRILEAAFMGSDTRSGTGFAIHSANRGAVLNHYRWVDGHPDSLGDLTDYRHYVLNREVGHILGLGHVDCPGSGVPAPVMQQQSLGLNRCAPNPWPYPH